MTANGSPFYQNLNPDKKPSETVEKDIRKWVESVVEFKANLDKLKNESTAEKQTKKLKKFKVKKKPSLVLVQVNAGRKVASAQRKSLKNKKSSKKSAKEKPEKGLKKAASAGAEVFNEIKESYRNLKLPQNWTSGTSSGRVVFNRVKVTTFNAQQKMLVDRSLVITKDRNVHILINGSEIALHNWEMQRVDNIDDVKKAIKEIDLLKICEGPANPSPKGPDKIKLFQASKSETTNPQKTSAKKVRAAKKPGSGNKILNQKSFQK